MSRIETRIERLEEAENPTNTAMRAVLRSITGVEPSREECNITLEQLVAGANEPDEGGTE